MKTKKKHETFVVFYVFSSFVLFVLFLLLFPSLLPGRERNVPVYEGDGSPQRIQDSIISFGAFVRVPYGFIDPSTSRSFSGPHAHVKAIRAEPCSTVEDILRWVSKKRNNIGSHEAPLLGKERNETFALPKKMPAEDRFSSSCARFHHSSPSIE